MTIKFSKIEDYGQFFNEVKLKEYTGCMWKHFPIIILIIIYQHITLLLIEIILSIERKLTL